MKCATHPKIETNLCCGKCGKPICPKCMVTTLVGARCRDCAAIKRLPTYQVSPVFYLRALGAGVASGVAIGFAWFLALSVIPFAGFFSIILAGAAGYGVGVLIGLSVNKKKGLGLSLIGVGSFLLSFVVHLLVLGYAPSSMLLMFASFAGIYQIIGIIAGIFMAVSQLK